MRRHVVLLLRRLLPQAASLHPMPVSADDVRLLLPKAAALHAVLLPAMLSGQLLSQAVPEVLLACVQTNLLRSARLQRRNPGSRTVVSKTAVDLRWTIQVVRILTVRKKQGSCAVTAEGRHRSG